MQVMVPLVAELLRLARPDRQDDDQLTISPSKPVTRLKPSVSQNICRMFERRVAGRRRRDDEQAR